MVILIDNYDSFSYNLYQLTGTITQDIKVIRNDELQTEEIERLAPNASHIAWCPRHTPRTGTFPLKYITTSSHIPASAGFPGPGDIIICEEIGRASCRERV